MMYEDSASTALAPTMVKGCLVVSLPGDLAGELDHLREVVLAGVREQRAHSLILDFSAVQLLDGWEFAQLRATLSMAALLGASAVLCGLRPGIVAYLVLNDVDTQGLVFARDLDEALSATLDTGAMPAIPQDDTDSVEPDFPEEGEVELP